MPRESEGSSSLRFVCAQRTHTVRLIATSDEHNSHTHEELSRWPSITSMLSFSAVAVVVTQPLFALSNLD